MFEVDRALMKLNRWASMAVGWRPTGLVKGSEKKRWQARANRSQAGVSGVPPDVPPPPPPLVSIAWSPPPLLLVRI
jgi:hypothetical protein